MDTRTAENQLVKAANARLAAEDVLRSASEAERAAIVDAWRASIPPTRIAELVRRTSAHVRTLRPDDVPPARLGGGAAPKRRRKKPTT